MYTSHHTERVISPYVLFADEKKTHLLYTGQEILSDITVFLGFVFVPHLAEPRAQRQRIHVQYTVQIDGHDVWRLHIEQSTCFITR